MGLYRNGKPLLIPSGIKACSYIFYVFTTEYKLGSSLALAINEIISMYDLVKSEVADDAIAIVTILLMRFYFIKIPVDVA